MEYQPKGSQIDADGLHDFMKEQIDRLTEENKKLKEDIDDAVENHFADLKLRETTHKEWNTLEQENKKLRKELDEEKVASWNFYQECDEELKEGIKQLTQEKKKLRKQIEDYWKVDDEIGGFVDGKFPDIASHLKECWEAKERTLFLGLSFLFPFPLFSQLAFLISY